MWMLCVIESIVKSKKSLKTINIAMLLCLLKIVVLNGIGKWFSFL